MMYLLKMDFLDSKLLNYQRVRGHVTGVNVEIRGHLMAKIGWM
jgi:hypothetical protein